jgi:hypothetical protein
VLSELIKQLGGCGGIGRHIKNINQLKINRWPLRGEVYVQVAHLKVKESQGVQGVL